MRRAPLALATAVALTLSACASSVGGTKPGGDLSIILSEFKFAPAALSVAAGAPITFKLRNSGTVDHDLTIDKAGLKIVLKVGESGEKTISGLAAGSYEVYCSIPGHKDAGMKATLEVK